MEVLSGRRHRFHLGRPFRCVLHRLLGVEIHCQETVQKGHAQKKGKEELKHTTKTKFHCNLGCPKLCAIKFNTIFTFFREHNYLSIDVLKLLPMHNVKQ